jgi:hypothetical protein
MGRGVVEQLGERDHCGASAFALLCGKGAGCACTHLTKCGKEMISIGLVGTFDGEIVDD